MSEYIFKTPILFVIFNRPDTTRKVFERIKMVKPPILFVAADGPRVDKENEAKKCQLCREIIKEIDWDCRVETKFSDVNIGCKRSVSEAISWALSIVDRIIILEDDILADLSFFRFCQEMLERYKDDNRIMSVTGNNVGYNDVSGASYGFSSVPYIWGWATWRRAWNNFDIDMKLWPEADKKGVVQQTFFRQRVVEEWRRKFQDAYDGIIKEAWDYQWVFSMMINRGMGIVPEKNLIKNIGFGEDATHTFDVNCEFANLKVSSMKFPLKHPKFFFPVDLYEGRRSSIKDVLKIVLKKINLYNFCYTLYRRTYRN